MSKMRTATRVFICLIFGSGCWSGLASAEKSENDKQAEDRIVGGNPSSRFYAWLVSIHDHGRIVCGGSILNPTTILTAASCFDDTDTDSITIRAGNIQLMGVKDVIEQRIAVKKIIKHWKFDMPINDFAILKLEEPVEFNPYVFPINLATPWKDNVVTSINDCVVAGYGTIDNEGEMPETLQEIETKLASRSYCRRYVAEHYSYYGIFNKNFLCTQDFDKGSCTGDGGSPLVCYDGWGDPYLMGVLSWGANDCFLGFNVYGRVSEFITWIENLS